MKNWIGCELIDSLSLDNKRLNYLFILLISSILWILIGGNIFIRTEAVFFASIRVTAASLAVVLLFYSLSYYAKSLIWGMVLTSIALWISVYFGILGRYALYTFIGISGIYSVRNFKWQTGLWMQIITSGFIAALAILFIEPAYTSFDIASKITRGAVHQDTLFHASIAAMIKNYGVTSTGLNGLVPLSYHVLSHVFFAALSLLSGVSILEVYGIAPWVLFAPLLIFSIVSTIAILDKSEVLDVPRLWAITCLVLVALPYLFSNWLLGISYFISESYLVALGLFSLTLPLLLKRRLSNTDVLLIFLTAALIAYAKGSVGLIYSGLWLARLLFINERRKFWGLLSVVASAIGVYVVTYNSAHNAIDSYITISWFHFFAHYTNYGACIIGICNPFSPNTSIPIYLDFAVLVLGFFLLHFAPSFMLVALAFIEFGFKRTIKSPIMIYIGASTLAGIIITSSLAIPGGGAYYFSNVAMFVALPTFIALVAMGSQLFLNKTVTSCFVLLLVFCIKYPSIVKTISLTPVPTENKLIEVLADMRKTSSMHYIYLLKDFSKANTQNPMSSCDAQPFIYPALSERPWTGVIGYKDKCDYNYYGYASYNIPLNENEKMPPPMLQGMTLKIKDF